MTGFIRSSVKAAQNLPASAGSSLVPMLFTLGGKGKRCHSRESGNPGFSADFLAPRFRGGDKKRAFGVNSIEVRNYLF